MTETLHRNIPSPGERDRYGTWRLTSDDEAAEASGQLPLPGSEASAIAVIEDYPAYQEEVLALMRRQLGLSVVAALVLFGLVGGVMVAGYVWFDALARPIWHGFSISFLFVAVLVYPLTWSVAMVYTILSNRMDGLQ